MALQIRKGTEGERTAGGGVVFALGELVYVTDTDALYIGDGSTAGGVFLTNNAVGTIGDFLEADTNADELQLQKNLNLNSNNILGTGNITIDGNITATGNIDIGDNISDTVTITAQVDSNITPTSDTVYDLGSQSLRWRNVFASGLTIDGEIDAVAVNANTVADNSTVMVNVATNEFVGDLTGDVTGNVIGNVTGDLTGSVFSDDSTLLVDGTNGTVPGTLTGSWNNTDSVFNVIGEGIGVATGSTSFLVSDSGINFANTDNSENISLLIGSGNFSISASGSATIALGGAVTAATGAVTWAVNGTASLTSEDLSWAVNGPVTLAADNISIGPSGVDADLTGSVFADDSTLLVDAVAGEIPGENVTGTITATFVGNVTGDVTANTVLTANIGTEDSSALTVLNETVFNSDVTVENNLIISDPDSLITNHIKSIPGSLSPVFFDSDVELNEGITIQGNLLAFGEVNSFQRMASTQAIGVGVFIDEFTPSIATTTIDNNLASFGTPVQFASYSDTEIANFETINNGTVIYNSTTSKFQGYQNGSWVTFDTTAVV